MCESFIIKNHRKLMFNRITKYFSDLYIEANIKKYLSLKKKKIIHEACPECKIILVCSF